MRRAVGKIIRRNSCDWSDTSHEQDMKNMHKGRVFIAKNNLKLNIFLNLFLFLCLGLVFSLDWFCYPNTDYIDTDVS
jgi:hypothetical protein